MLNDKQYNQEIQYQIDKEQLRLLREDRNELMQQINDLDSQEVNIIKMMVKP
jgi:hypothetical protein